MILRALFWIAVVAVFMPREPDLGFGRPGLTLPAGITLPASMPSMDKMSGAMPAQACATHADMCGSVLTAVDQIQGVLVRSLAQVKAEIEQQRRERSSAGS